MLTKFVSKNSNYMIVLRPGVEGSRALGTHAIPGLYVKFQSGVLDVNEDSVTEMLRKHTSYGIDFLEVKQDELDPYLDTREDIEPVHVIQDIKYGHVEGGMITPKKTKLTPQLKKVIEAEAVKMLPGLLKQNPQMLKDIILGLAEEMKSKAKKEDSEEEKQSEESQKRGPGRPPKTE